MVARLAAGIDGALLFILEEFDEFRYGGFLYAEAFLARMISRLRTGLGCAARERSEPR